MMMIDLLTRLVVENLSNWLGFLFEPVTYILLGLLVNSATDVYNRRLYDVVTTVVFAAAVVQAGILSNQVGHWLPIMVALTLSLAYFIVGRYLEEKEAWSSGDTFLFAALGCATFTAPIAFLAVFLIDAVAWVKGFDKKSMGAPLFTVAYVTWLMLV